MTLNIKHDFFFWLIFFLSKGSKSCLIKNKKDLSDNYIIFWDLHDQKYKTAVIGGNYLWSHIAVVWCLHWLRLCLLPPAGQPCEENGAAANQSSSPRGHAVCPVNLPPTTDVVIHRKESEGFGFVIISSLNRPETTNTISKSCLHIALHLMLWWALMQFYTWWSIKGTCLIRHVYL